MVTYAQRHEPKADITRHYHFIYGDDGAVALHIPGYYHRGDSITSSKKEIMIVEVYPKSLQFKNVQ